MGVIIGIDIGTHRSKGVACTPDGTVVGRADVEHACSIPAPGFVEHDADGVWWHDLCELSRRLVPDARRSGGVDAIAITTCGPCLLPVDSRGAPLRPAILYGIDVRAAAQIATLESRIGRRAIEQLSWSSLTSQSVGPKIQWLAEREPNVYEQTALFHTATSYLVFRLTGEAFIDYHQASYFAPFIDARRRVWDDRYADGLDLLPRLPPLRWPSEIAGMVTQGAARWTGLPPGIPVLVGSSDGLAEAVGVGAVEPGIAAASYGSTASLTTFNEHDRRSRQLWRTEGFARGRPMLGGGLSTSGAITTWFVREFARELPQGTAEEDARARATLSAEASASPVGSNGLLMLPYFGGERTPFADPSARGVLAGMRTEHTRGDLYRAVLESIAFGVRHVAEAFGAIGASIGIARATGGASVDRVWLKIAADVTGIDHEVTAETDGAPYGISLLAAQSLGLDAGRPRNDWVRVVDVVRADPVAHERYAPAYELYRQLYRDTRGIVHRLAATAQPSGPVHPGRGLDQEVAAR